MLPEESKHDDLRQPLNKRYSSNNLTGNPGAVALDIPARSAEAAEIADKELALFNSMNHCRDFPAMLKKLKCCINATLRTKPLNSQRPARTPCNAKAEGRSNTIASTVATIASVAGSELLFDLTSSGYECHGLIVTSILPAEHFMQVLNRERLTNATSDRLSHRCRVLAASGQSFRFQNAGHRKSRPAPTTLNLV